MLIRVAENLYWIGRYIERTEHISRFQKVQFYSTMDSVMSRNKDFALRSILFMSGTEFDLHQPLNENEVWKKVIFDANNPNSIFNVIKSARENARSIKNSISSELWESINKLYLHCKNLDSFAFTSSDIHTFSEDIASHIAVIKSNVTNTMMHHDNWHFLSLGIFVERGLQVLRIMKNKISDWVILSDNGVNTALMQYQWTILLKSLECFDVHNNYYRGLRSKQSIFKLILSNGLFPRSIKYTGDKIHFHLTNISVKPDHYTQGMEFIDASLKQCLDFKNYEDEEEVVSQVSEAYDCISDIHTQIKEMYFK
ncbi:MAG: alpha-E domain-containing protein [Saprospiraceae bacterium]|nr:alpha-E domain-containing protein [Saprospiraceae bacterium]